jgi:hypothetical protein
MHTSTPNSSMHEECLVVIETVPSSNTQICSVVEPMSTASLVQDYVSTSVNTVLEVPVLKRKDTQEGVGVATVPQAEPMETSNEQHSYNAFLDVTTLENKEGKGVAVMSITGANTCSGGEPMVRKNQDYVSPSFNTILEIPQLKKKVKKEGKGGPVMPKAASGRIALGILQKQAEFKRQQEVAKIKRKVDREQKKVVKDEEKRQRAVKVVKQKEERLRKKIENDKRKQEKAKSREDARKKSTVKRKGVKTNLQESDSESDLENVEMVLEDSDRFSDLSFDKIDTDLCAKCGGKEVDPDEWVGCDECPRFMHITCTADLVLMSLSDPLDIEGYPFKCVYCDF